MIDPKIILFDFSVLTLCKSSLYHRWPMDFNLIRFDLDSLELVLYSRFIETKLIFLNAVYFQRCECERMSVRACMCIRVNNAL